MMKLNLSVSNANSMDKGENSIGSKFIQKNLIAISGYPCHLAHGATSHTKVFSDTIG